MTTNYLQWVQAQKAQADEKYAEEQRSLDRNQQIASTVANVIGSILGFLMLLL